MFDNTVGCKKKKKNQKIGKLQYRKIKIYIYKRKEGVSDF